MVRPRLPHPAGRTLCGRCAHVLRRRARNHDHRGGGDGRRRHIVAASRHEQPDRDPASRRIRLAAPQRQPRLHPQDARGEEARAARHRGGRNVRIIGGVMLTKVKGPNVVIMDDAGTHVGRVVHIEGLVINGTSGVPSDGIKIKAPKTIVQLEEGPHHRTVGHAVRIPRRRGAAGRRRQAAADRRLHRLEPLQQLLLPAGDRPAQARDRQGRDQEREHVRLHQPWRPASHAARDLDRNAGKPAVRRLADDQLQDHESIGVAEIPGSLRRPAYGPPSSSTRTTA